MLLSSVATSAQDTRESARTQRVERWLEQAERSVRAGRIAQALPVLRRAQQLAPEDPRAPLRIAELLLPLAPSAGPPSRDATRASQQARAALEAFLAASAATVDPAVTTARARAEAWRQWTIALDGDHAAAIDATIAGAGLQDATAAASLRRLAALAVLRDDLSTASRALEAARAAMPQDPELLAELATVSLARGRTREAVSLFEAVVARRPGDLEALRDLAGARMAAGDPRAAATLLDGVARQLPDASDVHLELARARLESGDREGAVEAARVAQARAASDDPEPSIVLGQALTALGREAEARAAFDEALRRRPGNARAREALRALGSRPE